ncbi:MAG TPA: hypothetical protein PK413_04305 [Thermoanaerobaculia bacterium]|nr:hypothetical protein [Thermoanaerobaculia bacterium]
MRFFENGPQGTVTRVLLELAGGERLILTSSVNARTGQRSDRLAADADGSWVEVASGTGCGGADNAAYHRCLAKERTPWNFAAPLRLSSSLGPSLARTLPPRGHQVDFAGFGHWLSRQSAGRELARALPQSLVQALGWLEGVFLGKGRAELEPELAWQIEPLTEALLPALRREGRLPGKPTSARPWREEKGPSGQGLSLTEPALLELASRFRSLRAADPLGGARVADLPAKPGS